MLPRQENTLDDIIRSHGKWNGAKTAVIFEKDRVSWHELDKSVSRVANALANAGIGKGDSVGIAMANSLENLTIMFGIVRAGAVMVPLSTMQPTQVLERLVRDAGTKLLFVSQAFTDLGKALGSAPNGLPAENVIAVGFSDSTMKSYSAFLESASDEDPNMPIGPDDPCTIIYSSGTTSIPKGIVQTHFARNYFATMLALDLRFDSTAIALLTTPLYSNGTFMMMLPAMLVGGTIVIMPSFEPRRTLERIQAHRCTHTFMVPTQFARILDEGVPEGFDLSSLRAMVSAAAPLHERTREEILSRMGSQLFELYGMTECFGSLMKPEDMERKPGSVGKPFPGNDIRIIDDDGAELPWGSVGEIVGYSPALMTGYYNKPEQTKECLWRSEDGRTYVRSGDMARLDEDGYLYILDRKKDMILSGGFNVFPRDIEELLELHPDVFEAAVIGLPDPKWGESILGLVVLRGGKSVIETDLMAWANSQLAKYQRIAAIEFCESIPRNQLGKILKRQLRDRYAHEGRGHGEAESY